MSATATAEADAIGRRIDELTRLYAEPGWRLLDSIGRHLAAIEEEVGRFRRDHPPGHRCRVCRHLREKDAAVKPAGPIDQLAALQVIAWSIGNTFRSDLGLGFPDLPES